MRGSEQRAWEWMVAEGTSGPNPAARFGLALAVLFACVGAADGPRMENALPLAPTRLGGPAFVTGELQWDRAELLEGRLRFVLRDGPAVLVALETDPVALTAGVTYRFRQIIPIPADGPTIGMPEVDVEFLSESGRFGLGSIPLRVPQPGTWESVVVVAEPAARVGAASINILRKELALKEALSENEMQNAGPAETFAPTLPAADFPEQPLAYCAFDMVALPAESLQRMTARKLEAVTAWVRAGGAVCVNVEGPLEPKHAEFLNDLFHDSGGGPFLRDESGRIGAPDGTQDRVFARPAGLGFAAVVFGPLAEFDFDSPGWRTAHSRLWRMRAEYVRERTAGRAVEPRLIAQPTFGYAPDQQAVYQYNTWTLPTPSYGTAVVNALKPTGLRLLPGWSIVMLLVGYVAVVGPIDYVLLGRLRARKWTWVTFPVVTLAVTWGVVATADVFMSGNDYRRTVEIVDLDADGEPVRRTMLELLFRGSGQTVDREVKRSYFTPLDRRHFSANEENSAPTGPYVGVFPSRYSAPQRIAKWTPQVNRTFEIAPEVEVPKIDWDAIGSGTPSGGLRLPDGRDGFVSWSDGGKFNGPNPLGTVNDQPLMPYMQGAVYGEPRPLSPFFEAATFLTATERGVMQYQRSPLGFGRLDDLPFADSTDGDSRVVMVWVKDKDGNVSVYRKRVHAGAEKAKAAGSGG